MANEVKQEIFRLYKQGLSAREIMERLRLKKSNRTIGRWLRDAGISRPPGGSRCKWPLSVREQVFARYMKGETVPEIIRDFIGLKKGTTWKWLREAKVTRNAGAVKGKKNHFWRGGKYKSVYPEKWTNTLKESIRQRDNYKCQLCGVPQEECFRTLSIHHMDENKYNLNPENLISLCGQCHARVHTKGYILSQTK